MARIRRIMVRLSLPMEVSLTFLAGRRGMPESTVAYELLRQALQRTSDSAEVQGLIADKRAHATNAEWHEFAADAAEELKRCTQTEETTPTTTLS